MNIAPAKLFDQALDPANSKARAPDAALGHIGNLAFTRGAGATKRAPRPGLYEKLKNVLQRALANPNRRAELRKFHATRKSSASAGAVLGALTATTGLASEKRVLRETNELLRHAGNLDALLHPATEQEHDRGTENPDRKSAVWGHAIERHMKRLGTEDIVAMKAGILRDTTGLRNKFSGHHRSEIIGVIDHAGRALDDEIKSRATQEPLETIINLFAEGKTNIGKMDKALEALSVGAGMLKSHDQSLQQFLSPALQRFTDEQLGTLAEGLSLKPLTGRSLNALKENIRAYAGTDEQKDQRAACLDSLQAAVADQIHDRLNQAAEDSGNIFERNFATGGKSAESTYKSASRHLDMAISRLKGAHTSATDSAVQLRDKLQAAVLANRDVDLIRTYVPVYKTELLMRLKESSAASMNVVDNSNLTKAIDLELDKRASSLEQNMDRALATLNQAVDSWLSFCAKVNAPPLDSRLKNLVAAVQEWREDF